MIQSDKVPKLWFVHKFGGTSVQSAERMVNVARILKMEIAKNPGSGTAIVVSAMKGVTDGLIQAVERAQARDRTWHEIWARLKQKHLEAVEALSLSPTLVVSIENDFKDLWEVLRGIELVQSSSERVIEFVSGYGELWSAQILTQYLKKMGTQARYLDARDVLTVQKKTDHFLTGSARVVDWTSSLKRLTESIAQSAQPSHTLVITGYVASTDDGIPTTLGRNGSDFSASIFGRLLGASAITIWTDVDGVMSADPNLVPDAVVLQEMSYSEVTELANFGAKVVHPATMEPAIQDQIPIYIRNTFNPSFEGTKIHGLAKSSAAVKGFSAIEKVSLVSIEGRGLMGVPGASERFFAALRTAKISVIMISQASSEHSISVVVSETNSDAAKLALRAAFYAEIHQGSVEKIAVQNGKCILAAVGDNMVETPGVAGKFFSALGRVGISINSIAQGASERNISAVIDAAQASLALRAVHAAFYLSPQTIGIGLIGTGRIGQEFLNQLKAQLPTLKENFGIDLRVRGILTSKKMRLDDAEERGILPEDWSELNQAADVEKFTTHLRSAHLPHAVIIDATASEAMPALYSAWLRSGLHLITPNKKANAGAYADYLAIKRTAFRSQRRYYYSTNVGAGLPILQTIRDFFQTGDQMKSFEGVLSGTVSYLFNQENQNQPLSSCIQQAMRLGLTEPDPREDLSGMDVARKLVIIAREAGLPLEISDVEVENLVPVHLRGIPLADYLERITEGDSAIQKKWMEARAKKEVLRYVGQIDETGRAEVRLRSYPTEHVFAKLSASDNIAAFYTARYSVRPLVIQGPGAGPEVTAAGVFADLLRLAAALGAPTS